MNLPFPPLLFVLSAMAVLLPAAGAVVFLTATDVGLPDIMADGRGLATVEREAAANVELADFGMLANERDLVSAEVAGAAVPANSKRNDSLVNANAKAPQPLEPDESKNNEE